MENAPTGTIVYQIRDATLLSYPYTSMWIIYQQRGTEKLLRNKGATLLGTLKKVRMFCTVGEMPVLKQHPQRPNWVPSCLSSNVLDMRESSTVELRKGPKPTLIFCSSILDHGLFTTSLLPTIPVPTEEQNVMHCNRKSVHKYHRLTKISLLTPAKTQLSVQNHIKLRSSYWSVWSHKRVPTGHNKEWI